MWVRVAACSGYRRAPAAPGAHRLPRARRQHVDDLTTISSAATRAPSSASAITCPASPRARRRAATPSACASPAARRSRTGRWRCRGRCSPRPCAALPVCRCATGAPSACSPCTSAPGRCPPAGQQRFYRAVRGAMRAVPLAARSEVHTEERSNGESPLSASPCLRCSVWILFHGLQEASVSLAHRHPLHRRLRPQRQHADRTLPRPARRLLRRRRGAASSGSAASPRTSCAVVRCRSASAPSGARCSTTPLAASTASIRRRWRRWCRASNAPLHSLPGTAPTGRLSRRLPALRRGVAAALPRDPARLGLSLAGRLLQGSLLRLRPRGAARGAPVDGASRPRQPRRRLLLDEAEGDPRRALEARLHAPLLGGAERRWWATFNGLCHAFRWTAERYVRVVYEDFARDPAAALARILAGHRRAAGAAVPARQHGDAGAEPHRVGQSHPLPRRRRRDPTRRRVAATAWRRATAAW